MATPTNVKTWEFDLNNTTFADNTTVGNAYESAARRLFQIKEILINNGKTTFSAPWTVVSSSDSSTSGASDLWIDAGDLVWTNETSGNVFSWIILQQPAISSGFHLHHWSFLFNACFCTRRQCRARPSALHCRVLTLPYTCGDGRPPPRALGWPYRRRTLSTDSLHHACRDTGLSRGQRILRPYCLHPAVWQCCHRGQSDD
jgi:hypothetical protein